MSMFSSGSFTTSTPFHKLHDSGFYENSPKASNSLQISAAEDLETEYYPIRKTLFGKRRNICQNIPYQQFSQKQKSHSNTSLYSHKNDGSNKETPRTSRCLEGVIHKPVHFNKVKTPRQSSQLLLNSYTNYAKQLDKNDSGFHDKSSKSPKTKSFENSFSQLLEILHNQKEEINLKYLIDSEVKSYPDLTASEMKDLYNIYRFQRMGLKPHVPHDDYCKKLPLENEVSEMLLLSWKDKLECISADLEKQPKIDVLGRLLKMNLHAIAYNILSYLPGQDLQSASSVSQMWRNLIVTDKCANEERLCYLKQRLETKKEREIKENVNPFQRPENFKILGSIENIQQKEQFQLKTTIKEKNFEAFIEVGKRGNRIKPKKCPSCSCLSLQDKKVITKFICLFCDFQFCCNCLKPYSNWHFCAASYIPAKIGPVNNKKYLRRL